MRNSNKIGYLIVATLMLSFASCKKDKFASISTTGAKELTGTTAVIEGFIADEGYPEYTEKGICYAEKDDKKDNSYPVVSGKKVIVEGEGTGSFSGKVTGLKENTFYYARAYAINTMGTAYGNQITFYTLIDSIPNVTTLAAQNVTNTSALLGGKINYPGFPEYFERGICISKLPNPKVSDSTSFTIEIDETETFYQTVDNLENLTTYYVCAYAKNKKGICYGNEIIFKTGVVSKIRFIKEKQYEYCTEMGVASLVGVDYELLISHNFGTAQGISQYYEIPSERLYPVFYYTEPGKVGWNFCFNTPNTYEFKELHQYTLVCKDNGSSLIFEIIDEGLISSKKGYGTQTDIRTNQINRQIIKVQKDKVKAVAK